MLPFLSCLFIKCRFKFTCLLQYAKCRSSELFLLASCCSLCRQHFDGSDPWWWHLTGDSCWQGITPYVKAPRVHTRNCFVPRLTKETNKIYTVKRCMVTVCKIEVSAYLNKLNVQHLIHPLFDYCKRSIFGAVTWAIWTAISWEHHPSLETGHALNDSVLLCPPHFYHHRNEIIFLVLVKRLPTKTLHLQDLKHS